MTRRQFVRHRTRSGSIALDEEPMPHDPMELPPELRSKLPDPDMQEAPRALLRAARRAREIAKRTGTGVVVFRDGKVVEVSPDDDMEDSLAVSRCADSGTLGRVLG